MTIGTAKPAWRTSDLQQHLFDVVDTPGHFSNAAYQKRVRAQIDDCRSRGKRIVIVGGSGFYYQTLLFDYVPLQGTQRETCQAYPRTWEHLQTIDPVRAQAINPNDQYRIDRALAVYYEHGILPSNAGMYYKPYTDYTLVHVTRDTQDLYARINARTQVMLEDGWLEESVSLAPEWKAFVRSKKIIGYDDILDYHEGAIAQPEMVERIQQKTRNYAKRQRTFFRSLLKKIPAVDHGRIHEFNLTLSPVDLYLNQLVQSLV